MLVSSSDGFWREALLAAILLMADILAVVVVESFEMEAFATGTFCKVFRLAHCGRANDGPIFPRDIPLFLPFWDFHLSNKRQRRKFASMVNRC